MNKNKFIALTLGFAVLATNSIVYAGTNIPTSVKALTSSSVVGAQKTRKKPVISIDISGENKKKLLDELGLTEDEFKELNICHLKIDKCHKKTDLIEDKDEQNSEKSKRKELTKEQKEAKLKEKADELGITVEELKAKKCEKNSMQNSIGNSEHKSNEQKGARRNHNIINLSEDDIDTLSNSTGIEEDELLALLKTYETVK